MTGISLQLFANFKNVENILKQEIAHLRFRSTIDDVTYQISKF